MAVRSQAVNGLAVDALRIEELPSDDNDEDYEDIDDDEDEDDDDPLAARFRSGMSGSGSRSHLPLWLKLDSFNLFHEDDDDTATLRAQAIVTEQCRPLLRGEDSEHPALNSHGLPHLRREEHARFLHASLGKLPAPYAALDAARPWLFYWAICGLTTLGEDVSGYRERLMDTIAPLQNATGGIGGGQGQYSHCAGTYATVLALAAVDGLEAIDRESMWHFLGSVKQADGGFQVAVGAEEDIRGAYCAMTVITLLNLPLQLPPEAPARRAGLCTFTDRLGDWIRRCQTFEGGVAAAPGNEAHGAYAFCALACLSVLDAPDISVPQYLDVPALLRWMATMQTSSEGGFAGRANKLVDACYSHWVGGCWALIEAALHTNTRPPSSSPSPPSCDLWNRAALIRYLLCCCQQPGRKGGMRDKPSAHPDAYHTCYSLAGLSAAQHHFFYDNASVSLDDMDIPSKDTAHPARLTAGFKWSVAPTPAHEKLVNGYDAQDVVHPVHPVFVLPMRAVQRAQAQFRHSSF